MDPRYAYIDGRIVPLDEARISPLDIGLLRGYAVFDLLRTARGVPFLLDEHLQRLHGSAQQLGLIVPVSDADIVATIDELLRLNGHEEATVRLVLTGGVSPDGLSFDPTTPTFYILTHELVRPPASLYENGGKLLIHEHRREVPEAKTTNYLTMLHDRPRAVAEGALDLLYHDRGRLFEAASASFYPVRGNTILVPAEKVLWGTVGSYVLELARERYEVVTGDVWLEDAFGADEAFLTSTTRGVVPIVKLDEHVIGTGEPGPVTRYLMERWREAVGEA